MRRDGKGTDSEEDFGGAWIGTVPVVGHGRGRWDKVSKIENAANQASVKATEEVRPQWIMRSL